MTWKAARDFIGFLLLVYVAIPVVLIGICTILFWLLDLKVIPRPSDW